MSSGYVRAAGANRFVVDWGPSLEGTTLVEVCDGACFLSQSQGVFDRCLCLW